MRRTQLYLDEQLWGALHARAQSEKTSISELVRQAVRDRYIGYLERPNGGNGEVRRSPQA